VVGILAPVSSLEDKLDEIFSFSLLFSAPMKSAPKRCRPFPHYATGVPVRSVRRHVGVFEAIVGRYPYEMDFAKKKNTRALSLIADLRRPRIYEGKRSKILSG